MTGKDISRRLAAVRRIASRGPVGKAAERLATIADLASGKGDLDAVFRGPKQTDLGKRLAEGQASRSPMAGDPKPEKKKKRTAKEGHDRKDKSGRDRGE